MQHTIFFIEATVAALLLVIFPFLKKKKSFPSISATTEEQSQPLTKPPLIITSQDIKAIAGDNVITTQLDLARAYIEIGKKKIGKKNFRSCGSTG